MPCPNLDDSCTFTKSERNLLNHQRLKGKKARHLKDLIQFVLHHPELEFNAANVDHNMYERLMRAVEDGQKDILDMCQEGDGQQDV